MMLAKIEAFILWLGRFVEDSRTKQPSVKRYGLALAVTALCGVMLGLGMVMAYSMLNASGRDQVDMFRIAASTLEVISMLVLTAVSGTYLWDKAANRKAIKDESIGERAQD